MGLLYLVKEHHRVRLSAHSLCKVAAFLITYVARRRTNQTCNRVLFHELAHVYADHGLLGVEQELRQGLCKLCLTNSSGPKEDKGANGPVWCLEPCTGTPHRIGYSDDGLFLAYHPLSKLLLQVDELFALTLHELAYRYSSPLGDNGSNVFCVHLLLEHGLSFLLKLLELLLFFLKLLLKLWNLAVEYLCNLVEVAKPLLLLCLNPELVYLLLDVPDALDHCLFFLPAGLQGIALLTQVGKLFLYLGKPFL